MEVEQVTKSPSMSTNAERIKDMIGRSIEQQIPRLINVQLNKLRVEIADQKAKTETPREAKENETETAITCHRMHAQGM